MPSFAIRGRDQNSLLLIRGQIEKIKEKQTLFSKT